jgi:hypothetical protein
MRFTNGVLSDARVGKTISTDVCGTMDISARSGRIDLPADQAGLNLWLEVIQYAEPQLALPGICQAIISVEADGRFKILIISEETSDSG